MNETEAERLYLDQLTNLKPGQKAAATYLPNLIREASHYRSSFFIVPLRLIPLFFLLPPSIFIKGIQLGLIYRKLENDGDNPT